MAIGELHEVVKKLQKNALAMALYKNKEGKYLICKTPYFNQFTLPCITVDETKSITYFLNPILEEEFNIVPMITNYLETIRGIYLKETYLTIGNILCIQYKDYKTEIPSKDENITNSIIYTEKQYISYEQALQLYSTNKLNSYSMYCIEREYNHLEG